METYQLPITKDEALKLLRDAAAGQPGGSPSNHDLHRMARNIMKFVPMILEGQEWFKTHTATTEQVLFVVAVSKAHPQHAHLLEALRIVAK